MSCYPLYSSTFKNLDFTVENEEDDIDSANAFANRFEEQKPPNQFDLVRLKIKRLQSLCDESHYKASKVNCNNDISAVNDILSQTYTQGIYSAFDIRANSKHEYSEYLTPTSKQEYLRNDASSTQQFLSCSQDINHSSICIAQNCNRGRTQEFRPASKKKVESSPHNLKKAIPKSCKLVKTRPFIINEGKKLELTKDKEEMQDLKSKSDKVIQDLESKFASLSKKSSKLEINSRQKDSFPSFYNQPQVDNNKDINKKLKSLFKIETPVNIELNKPDSDGAVNKPPHNPIESNRSCESYSHQNEDEIIDIIIRSSNNASLENKGSPSIKVSTFKDTQDTIVLKDTFEGTHQDTPKQKSSLDQQFKRNKTLSDNYISIDNNFKVKEAISSPNKLEIKPARCVEFTLKGKIIVSPEVRKNVKFNEEMEIIKYDEKNKVTAYSIYDETGELIYDSSKKKMNRSQSSVSIHQEIKKPKSKSKLKVKGILKKGTKIPKDGNFAQVSANSESCANDYFGGLHSEDPNSYSPNQSALQGLQKLLEECDSFRTGQTLPAVIDSAKGNDLVLNLEKEASESLKSTGGNFIRSKSLSQKEKNEVYLEKQLKVLVKIRDDKSRSVSRKKKEEAETMRKLLNSKDKTRKTAIAYESGTIGFMNKKPIKEVAKSPDKPYIKKELKHKSKKDTNKSSKIVKQDSKISC